MDHFRGAFRDAGRSTAGETPHSKYSPSSWLGGDVNLRPSLVSPIVSLWCKHESQRNRRADGLSLGKTSYAKRRDPRDDTFEISRDKRERRARKIAKWIRRGETTNPEKILEKLSISFERIQEINKELRKKKKKLMPRSDTIKESWKFCRLSAFLLVTYFVLKQSIWWRKVRFAELVYVYFS